MAEIRASAEYKRRHLALERAINQQYMEKLKNRIKQAKVSGQQAEGPANRNFANPGSAGKVPLAGAHVEPLLGRVAVKEHDDLLGEGFYVGSWEETLDSTFVISYAAPVASLFFLGTDSPDPAAPFLMAIRTFEQKGDDLTHLVDEYVGGVVEVDPFETHRQRTTTMPTAPDFRPPTVDAADRFKPTETPNAPDPDQRRDEPVPQSREVHETAVPASEEVQELRFDEASSRFRAEEILLNALERPKTGHLASVLATLQADQYKLVTWPADQPLIVQGGPGTGKTIVAAHRAAFLTNPWRPGGALRSVGLVGPTGRFVDHVRPVIKDLEPPEGLDGPGSKGVKVINLLDLLGQLAGGINIGDHQIATLDEQLADTDWQLLRFARRAAALLGSRQDRPRRLKVRDLVNALINRDPALQNLLAEEPKIATWCRQMVSYPNAAQRARYLPFLAACGLALNPPTHDQMYDHLIVDEAQDVRPLELAILSSMVRDDAAMSLFGDMNQSRNHWGYQGWSSLAMDMEWTDEEGRFAHETLHAGYRSTRQILSFANRVLPKGERQHRAIQQGPEVDVHRVRTLNALAERTDDEATGLLDEYRDGLVSVIAMEKILKQIEERFQQGGWSRDARDRNAWSKEGRRLGLLRPEAARGLEFDAVVVIPDEFPDDFGRNGLLFTSLTRAVRKLVVIHSQSLPNGMR